MNDDEQAGDRPKGLERGAKIDTIVWDLGGVLIDWDPRHLYRRVFDDVDEMERFLAEVCTWEWHHRHDGGVPFAESIPALVADHPAHAENIRLWETRYLDMVAGEIEESVDVLRDARALGIRQLALTNMPAEIDELLREHFDWFGLFDGLVVSGAEKIVKPDPAIYRILVDRFAVDPSTTAFVDDRAENVEAAASLGFHAIRFTDGRDLRSRLMALVRV